jgi:uncharacterized protein
MAPGLAFFNMEKITEKQAVQLLKKYSPSSKDFKAVLAHAKAVQKVALKICKKVKCDAGFVKTACLLHDIGRFQTVKAVKHGIVGAKILKEEGLPKHALVAEKHLGAGITKQEAKKLKLPAKDYLPKTIEEKIVCHADNLVFNVRIGTLKEAVERYNKELGTKCGSRVKKLGTEIETKTKKKV